MLRLQRVDLVEATYVGDALILLQILLEQRNQLLRLPFNLEEFVS
ncbi:hypothetical protein [Lysobacter gummosus]